MKKFIDYDSEESKNIDNYTEEYTGNYDNIENKEHEVTKEEILKVLQE